MVLQYKGVQIEQISIFKHPLLYINLFCRLIIDLLIWLKNFVIRRILLVLAIIIFWVLLQKVPALHTVKAFVIFTAYWLMLGIASSVGLGTGLHTFVLYLGPHIAKVAMVATNCGHLPDMVPSRWDFEHFKECRTQATDDLIGFFGILLAVQIQAFLWGFGTALGELPPYFVARKAAQTRSQLEKLQRQEQAKQAGDKKTVQKIQKQMQLEPEDQNLVQVRELKKKANPTLMERAKIMIFDNIEKYGFITILLCASIPNPLFDLAGVTCGNFRIPFRKFFIPTMIGKAIIKVHIQMLFIIAIFRKETINILVNIVQKFNEGMATTLVATIQKQREQLHHPKVDSQEALISKIWNIIIILMIGYFILSIINGQVKEKALKLRQGKKSE